MKVLEGSTIKINRGDTLPLRLTIPIYKTDINGDYVLDDEGNKIFEGYYQFKEGDIIHFGVYYKKGMSEEALLLKEITVTEPSESVTFTLSSQEMKIGELINKPRDYWYEVQLDDGEMVRTVIGYDDKGAKIMKLYPEGNEVVSND